MFIGIPTGIAVNPLELQSTLNPLQTHVESSGPMIGIKHACFSKLTITITVTVNIMIRTVFSVYLEIMLNCVNT